MIERTVNLCWSEARRKKRHYLQVQSAHGASEVQSVLLDARV